MLKKAWKYLGAKDDGSTASPAEVETLKTALAAAETRVNALEQELSATRDIIGKPHFVVDYSIMVKQLIDAFPLDEAMSRAVGGDYETTGHQIMEVIEDCGLKDGMSVIDLGCGSGRLAHQLGKKYDNIQYIGTDIVQELLDYAISKCPTRFQFILNHSLTLPAPDNSIDMIVVFSVFTHLLHQESYVYLEEARRVLRPGGRIVFSFLESAKNWPIFYGRVSNAKNGVRDSHLDIMIERSQIEEWATHLGMRVLGYDFGKPHQGHGQTVTVLQLRD